MIFFAKNAAKHPHVLLVCIISYATAIVKPFIPLKTSVLLLSKPPPRYCSSRILISLPQIDAFAIRFQITKSYRNIQNVTENKKSTRRVLFLFD